MALSLSVCFSLSCRLYSFHIVCLNGLVTLTYPVEERKKESVLILRRFFREDERRTFAMVAESAKFLTISGGCLG